MKPERYKDGSIFEFADKFGYKSPFGNWMEEERLKREQREQERAEREAEREAEKEAANPTNKTTRYGGVIYFVFLDDYINDSEKKQVVKNANDILKANQIPAKVVGIQHPQNVKVDKNGTKVFSMEGFTATLDGRKFGDIVENSTYRAVFLAEDMTFRDYYGESMLGSGCYGVTQGFISKVQLDIYEYGKESCYTDNYKGFDAPETNKFDKLMLNALTSLHELYHQLVAKLKGGPFGGIHTDNGYIDFYYRLKELERVLNYKPGYNESEEDIEKNKAMMAYARLYQSGVAYYDWSPNSWQRKLDPILSDENQCPKFNIMQDGNQGRIAYPKPFPNAGKPWGRDYAKCLFLSIDKVLMQFYFKYQLGTWWSNGWGLSELLNLIYKNLGTKGILAFYVQCFPESKNNLQLDLLRNMAPNDYDKLKTILEAFNKTNNGVLNKITIKDIIDGKDSNNNNIKKYE
jgi:hypothetical protein